MIDDLTRKKNNEAVGALKDILFAMAAQDSLVRDFGTANFIAMMAKAFLAYIRSEQTSLNLENLIDDLGRITATLGNVYSARVMGESNGEDLMGLAEKMNRLAEEAEVIYLPRAVQNLKAAEKVLKKNPSVADGKGVAAAKELAEALRQAYLDAQRASMKADAYLNIEKMQGLRAEIEKAISMARE